MTDQVLHIAVATPLRKTFDYLPRDEQDLLCLQPGMRVLVPWQKRTIVGIVVAIDPFTKLVRHKIRHIADILDEQPVLNHELMKLGLWASDYYQHPVGDVLFQMLPVLLRKAKNIEEPLEYIWQINPQQSLVGFGRAKKQQQLYNYLLENIAGCTTEQLIHAGFSKATIKSLADKSLLLSKAQTSRYSHLAKNTGPLLNPEQQAAVAKVSENIHQFIPFVLDGVTGSGKTEVYLRCIAEALKNQQQVLVLVPEIGLTPQTLARFEQRFDTDIVVLHSNLSDKQRCISWRKAQLGQARLVIGTRSAVFTSFKKLGLIVIDESHDSSFKQQDSFRYSARDLAIMRAKNNNIPIILGSATPSFETLVNIQRGRFQHLRLSQRAGNAQSPTYEVIDIRQQQLFAGLSPKTITAMKEHISAGNQVLLFLNRRGFAPTLMCHDCGWLAECKHCDARLTLHLSPKHLHCHHCDHTQRFIYQCAICQSPNVIPIGLGTERLEEHLGEVFSEYSICRIDRDSTSRKGALNRILDEIQQGKHQILLGTQMLAKGHHFPKVTLVVIVDADSGLFSVDFRSSERMAQLLIQVAGRAGRAEQPGHVLIQTHNPEHTSLQLLLSKGYHGFAEQTLTERQLALLPPYSYQALLRADSTKPELPRQFLSQVKQLLPSELVTSLGPIDAPMSKRAGRYRAQLLFQSENRSQLQHYLKQLVDKTERLKPSHNLRWSIDVDPIDTY